MLETRKLFDVLYKKVSSFELGWLVDIKVIQKRLKFRVREVPTIGRLEEYSWLNKLSANSPDKNYL